MLKRLLAVGVVASLGGCVSASQGTQCMPEASSFGFGQNSTWLLYVGGAGCSATLDLWGAMMTNSAIVQQAGHGAAFVSGTTYGYTPAAGFAGPDQFKMSLTGQGNAGSGTSIVTVNVVVRN